MIDLGESAPELCLPDTDGSPVDRSKLDGAALLVFLPAAFTPLCSSELSGLVGLAESLTERGVAVLAVACDSMFVLRTWAEGAGVGAAGPTLLSDFWPHGEVARRFQAFDEDRGIATRTSDLIDADGVIRWATQAPAGVARDLEDHRAAVERSLAEVA
ncbi:redoxin domain-containing protein [Pseudactinotalea sp.]|uniref:redoxin domain-containing protein n=1 Tax=Pseudactinotalea sp. TaxID=1926260 RepID=UPI003B3BB9F4